MKHAVSIILLVTLVLIVNFAPLLLAWRDTPEDHVFSGQASWFDPWDVNVYVSAIRSGQENGFYLQNMYTHADNPPIVYYPVYTTIGMMFGDSDPFILYHITSIIVSIVAVSTLYFFNMKIFKMSVSSSFLATLFITLGGGIGYILFPEIDSIDMIFTGATFTSSFQRPHEAIGIFSYVFGLLSFFLYTQEKVRRWWIVSLLCISVTAFLYPFYLLSFALIVGVYLMATQQLKRRITPLVLLLVCCSLIALFIIFNLLQNPTFSDVVNQKLTKPTPLSLFFGYFLFWLAWIYQLIEKRIKKHSLLKFLNIWISIVLLLQLVPVGFARFYLKGTMVPLGIIFLLTLLFISKEYLKELSAGMKAYLLTVVVLLTLGSNLFFCIRRIQEIDQHNHWYYLTSSENQMLSALAQVEKPSIVLTGYAMGNIIPARTHHRVYFGHLIQTPDAEQKIDAISSFYLSTTSQDDKEAFLKHNNIEYVVFTEEELVAYTSSPSSELQGLITHDFPFLTPIYQSSDAFLFSANTSH